MNIRSVVRSGARIELVLFVVIGLVAAGTVSSGSYIVAYPLIALCAGAGCAWLVRMRDSAHIEVSTLPRSALIVSLLFPTLIIITARLQPYGVSEWLYVIFIIGVGVLTALSLLVPSRVLLAPILLLGLALRVSFWNAAPIFGRDVKLHLALVRYIMRTGEVISGSVTYYHFYPTGHIFAATTGLVLDLPESPAMFASIGLACVIGVAIMAVSVIPRVTSLSKRQTTRAMLLTALFLMTAPFHIRYSTQLIAQSLMFVFVPLSLLIFVTDGNRLRIGCGLFAATILLVTHNLPGLVLAAFGLLIVGASRLPPILETRQLVRRPSTTYAALVLVGVIEYWAVANIFDLQFARVLGLFVSRGLSDESASIPAGTSAFLSPMLFIAIGLFFGGACLFAVFLALMRRYWNKDIDFAVEYFIATSVIFAGLGTTLVTGMGDTKAIRLVPLVPVFIAPLVGYFFAKLGSRGYTGVTIAIVLMLVFPSFMFLSATGPGASPADAITEHRPGKYHLSLSQSELSAGETIAAVAEDVYMSGFVENAVILNSRVIKPQNRVDKTTTIHGYDVLHSGLPTDCELVYMRDYYRTQLEVDLPDQSSRILDVGDASIQTC